MKSDRPESLPDFPVAPAASRRFLDRIEPSARISVALAAVPTRPARPSQRAPPHARQAVAHLRSEQHERRGLPCSPITRSGLFERPTRAGNCLMRKACICWSRRLVLGCGASSIASRPGRPTTRRNASLSAPGPKCPSSRRASGATRPGRTWPAASTRRCGAPARRSALVTPSKPSRGNS